MTIGIDFEFSISLEWKANRVHNKRLSHGKHFSSENCLILSDNLQLPGSHVYIHRAKITTKQREKNGKFKGI